MEQSGRLRLVVGIATSGRPAILEQTVADLGRQTRPPDRILVCAPAVEDLGAVALQSAAVECSVAPRGLTTQRNHILGLATGADLILFLDDDFFLHSRYLERMEQLFSSEADVVVATGQVIADGINGPGLRVEEAQRMLDAEPGQGDDAPAMPLAEVFNAYGCNMALRLAPVYAHALRFDPNLPLYGWYEDVDFSRQLARYGRVVRLESAWGVHLGNKGGRTSGVRLGYSQVANPFYLARKGTMPWHRALPSILSRSGKNLVRSLHPEPYVDRRGRLRGNLLGLWDVVRGKAHPLKARDL